MTQAFKIMCVTAVLTLALTIPSAYGQNMSPQQPDKGTLSNKREQLHQNNKKIQPSNQTPAKTNKNTTKREHTIVDLPGYPKYISTGQPEKDEITYQRAKALWIKENQHIYQNYLKEQSKKSPQRSVQERRAANPKN
jgi:hypothetical protein